MGMQIIHLAWWQRWLALPCCALLRLPLSPPPPFYSSSFPSCICRFHSRCEFTLANEIFRSVANQNMVNHKMLCMHVGIRASECVKQQLCICFWAWKYTEHEKIGSKTVHGKWDALSFLCYNKQIEQVTFSFDFAFFSVQIVEML